LVQTRVWAGRAYQSSGPGRPAPGGVARPFAEFAAFLDHPGIWRLAHPRHQPSGAWV